MNKYRFKSMTRSLSAVLAAALMLGSVSAAGAEEVKFAFLTDVHLCEGSPRIDNLKQCIEDINSQSDIQFTIFGGDITEFGADHEIALAKGIIDGLQKPYYIVAGNHDAKWSESGCNTFAKVFGYETFDFKAGGIRFLGCNSGPNMRMAPALMPHEALMWLDEVVSRIPEDEPVIFINHFPQDTSMLNYFQVINTLKKCNIQLLIGGHWHKNTILDYQGVPGILGRSPDKGKSLAYNIVTIKDGTLEVSQTTLRDEDGTPCNRKEAPWFTLTLSRKPRYTPDAFDVKTNPYGLPEDFPWMKFDVNEKYPCVKTQWRKQDPSDIGCGAVISGKYVVYANTQGIIKAVRAKDGEPVWSFTTSGKVFSTPAVESGKVVTGSTDGFIYCLSLKDGSLLWKFKCGKSVLASAAILDGVAFIGASDGIFRAIDINSGKLVWEFKQVRGFVESRPYADRTQVVFGDWGNTLYSLDTKSGSLMWEWRTKGSRMLSPAAVYPVKSNGKIFIVTPERKTYAIDASSGKTLWESKGGRESIALSPKGDRIFVKPMFGQIQSYSTEGENCNKLWEVDAGLGYEIGPTPCACSADKLFVPTDKGNIVCLNAEDGSLLWRHKISVALINSIVPVGNDRLLISTMDGIVTMLRYR